MRYRQPFAIDNLLFWWNLGLATFSAMGAARMVPELYWFFFIKFAYKKDFNLQGGQPEFIHLFHLHGIICARSYRLLDREIRHVKSVCIFSHSIQKIWGPRVYGHRIHCVAQKAPYFLALVPSSDGWLISRELENILLKLRFWSTLGCSTKTTQPVAVGLSAWITLSMLLCEFFNLDASLERKISYGSNL